MLMTIIRELIYFSQIAFLMRFTYFVNYWKLQFPRVFDIIILVGRLQRKEFHDPYQWEFTKELEENWKVIQKEFDNLQESLFHPWFFILYAERLTF